MRDVLAVGGPARRRRPVVRVAPIGGHAPSAGQDEVRRGGQDAHPIGQLDPVDALDEFPLWAKIWKASWVLAGYLADMPPDVNKRILEIGAGVGLVGMVAATFGHRVTMTEYNSDALNFARANACLNHCPDLPIKKLDWNHPELKDQFDLIVASEVTYNEENFSPLIRLFQSNLKPGGEIILASEIRESNPGIFRPFKSDFDITLVKKTLRSETVAVPIVLLKMRQKV